MGLRKTIFGRSKSKLKNGLVAYYKFDGNPLEATGLSPNATTANVTYIGGIIGNAANLILQNVAYIEVVNNSNFSFTTGSGNDVPFSISMWIYTTHFSSVGNWLINKRSGGTNLEYQLHLVPNGGIALTKFSNNSSSVWQSVLSGASTIALNNWYHIVVTDDGSKTVAGIKIYVNSVSTSLTDNSLSGPYLGMNLGTAVTRIGYPAWNIDQTCKHSGYMDELGIWKNRVLTQSDVNELYRSGTGKTYPF